MASLVLICHKCDQWKRPPMGHVPCLADPERRDIIKLAEELEHCPLGKFPNRRIGSWIAFVARWSGAKWVHYQGRRLVAWVGKRLGLVPPEFKVPYFCKRCGQAQQWLDRQHRKWQDRGKRRVRAMERLAMRNRMPSRFWCWRIWRLGWAMHRNAVIGEAGCGACRCEVRPWRRVVFGLYWRAGSTGH